MKNLSLTTLLILITLGFSSCSVEEDPMLQDEVSGKSFEKVSVKRNADGSYYLDMNLNDGVGVDVINNEKLNSKELNFYSTEENSKRSLNENLNLGDEGNFKLDVNNTINNNKSTITVYDNDIKFNRGSEDDHLADYSFTDNGDGTYDLDFIVDQNIEVDFVQNEATGAYEIHLDPDSSSSSQTDFSTTFTREPGETLNIIFVNYHHGDRTAKSSAATEDKPKIIVNG